MKSFQIKLSSIEDVRNFVNIISKYEVDMDLHSGRYTVDAKSLMGIFSLDLLKPIDFIIHCDDDDNCAKIMNEISQYRSN